jgi:hypothetical protein
MPETSLIEDLLSHPRRVPIGPRNQQVARALAVPGATHLFEEPGALERVAQLAGQWFTTHLNTHTKEARHG